MACVTSPGNGCSLYPLVPHELGAARGARSAQGGLQSCRRRAVNAQPVACADLRLGHLQGHEALANLLPRPNSFAARLPYACIRRKVEPLVRLGFVALDALAKSVADADIVKRFGIVQLGAAQWMAGIEGVSPISKSEIQHNHSGPLPGLTIVMGGFRPHTIEGEPLAPAVAARPAVKMIGTSRPHPLATDPRHGNERGKHHDD